MITQHNFDDDKHIGRTERDYFVYVTYTINKSHLIKQLPVEDQSLHFMYYTLSVL